MSDKFRPPLSDTATRLAAALDEIGIFGQYGIQASGIASQRELAKFIRDCMRGFPTEDYQPGGKHYRTPEEILVALQRLENLDA